MKRTRKFEEGGNHSFKSFSNTLIRAASCLFHVLKQLLVLQRPYISRGPSYLITYLQRWQSSNILFYLNSHFSICLELFNVTTTGSQSQPSSPYKFHNRNLTTLLKSWGLTTEPMSASCNITMSLAFFFYEIRFITPTPSSSSV